MSTFHLERLGNKEEAIGCTFDGGGFELDVGTQANVTVPYRCRIKRVTIEADQIGDIIIDIWATSFINYPPTISNSIVGGNPPTLSNALTYNDSVLTGWTTLIEANTSMMFVIQDVQAIQRAVIVLRVLKL